MKKRIIFISLISILFLSFFLFYDNTSNNKRSRTLPKIRIAKLSDSLWQKESEPIREIQTADGNDLVYESIKENDMCDIYQRVYSRNNGNILLMSRAESSHGEYCIKEWILESDGLIRYYDKANDRWTEMSFSNGSFSAPMLELELENGINYLIYTPKTYVRQEKNSLEYLPDFNGYLKLEQKDNHWTIGIWIKSSTEKCVSDYMVLRSNDPLLNWNHSYCAMLWKTYMLDGDSRWCYDGYYFPSPSSYTPNGEHYFYLSPASYFIKSMAFAASVHPAAEDMAIAMLDTMAEQQNGIGFWETSPESDWLKNDYDIGEGFYDSRFNTDLMEIYLKVYLDYGIYSFENILNRYIEFFVDYAEKHHFETRNGGWLIEDYYHPFGNETTHSSLNHHTAECILLYKLSEAMNRPDLRVLADKMLLGISDTTTYWIKANGDLHYCVFPDGTYGYPDYPYLTYNDLIHLQDLLIKSKKKPESSLNVLIDSKRLWMDANGISGYEK